MNGGFNDSEWPVGNAPMRYGDGVGGTLLSGMQYNWHRSGKLVELEKKWGIQSTAYLAAQKERFADWIK